MNEPVLCVEKYDNYSVLQEIGNPTKLKTTQETL